MQKLVVVALIMALFSFEAEAQNVQPYIGEMVQRRTGELVPPWKQRKLCQDQANSKCDVLVTFNERTGEIARVGDRSSTKFVVTMEGDIRRAESALAKATRLAGLSASQRDMPKRAPALRAPPLPPKADPTKGPQFRPPN